jgi:signal transduction histidine kinase
MADLTSRAFGRTLTATLALFGFLTVGALVLFGFLLFRTLSKEMVDGALVDSKLDAERIARGVAERSSGDLYSLTTRQTEIDRFVGNTLSERKVLNEVRVLDRSGKVVYQFKSSLQSSPSETGTPEGQRVTPVNPGATLETLPRSVETVVPIHDPYDIEVPIGDFGVLRVGLSHKELEGRVEGLRKTLFIRTFAAAAVALLGIGAASVAVVLLFQRNKRVEEARIEAERRAELGEVAAGLAHEIRNPLNAMGLNLELLEESLGRPGATTGEYRIGAATASELAVAVRQETQRLSRLLSDFLSYARPSPITPVPGDLNEPASEAVAFLVPEASRRNVRLSFTPSPAPALALLDSQRVKQVVLNLVGNALDAVESEGAKAREVDVRIEEAADAWRLTVADSGPGIHPSKLKEIFRAFVSTKPAGTGLGLPIAERIVKAHGGTLTLKSVAGEPTRAVATFPKAR